MSTQTPYLTKSRYVQGLACKKWLWLGWHDRLPYEEAEPGSPAAVGIEIGAHAHQLFPGGVVVEEAAYDHHKAVERTRALIDDESVPAIFEAAFDYDNIRIRADVMERLEDGRWGLREVKSSTRVKPEHVDDAAIQVFVLEKLGLDIASVELVHVDKTYVRGKTGIDWRQFFARTDLAADVRAVMAGLVDEVGEQRATLSRSVTPGIAPGPHCPSICPYWDKCTAHKTDDWIMKLPHMTARKFEALSDIGVDRIRNIPEDFALTEVQDRMRDVLLTGRAYISPNLKAALRPIEADAVYLDFEAMNPGIPMFEGTRPYQRIPFQWSLHLAASDGSLSHQEFLASGSEDPRSEFVSTLVAALEGSNRPIVVYSSYEKSVLNELAGEFPEHAYALEAIIDRLFDLLAVVRREIYLAEFHGSFSIKAVGPALAPELSYDDLETVKDGVGAAIAFEKLARGTAQSQEADVLRRSLLSYCERDTLAMVAVHRALERLA